MRNIFVDGDIVHTVVIPEEVRNRLGLKKKIWATQVLAEYLTKFYGPDVAASVRMSRSHNGKVTGTQAVIIRENKRITFMLVEPDKNLGKHEIHISRLEEDLDDSPMAAFDYRFSDQGQRARAPINSPFAALVALKD